MELAKDMLYEEFGWDKTTGMPTRATFERLNMKAVADELAAGAPALKKRKEAPDKTGGFFFCFPKTEGISCRKMKRRRPRRPKRT